MVYRDRIEVETRGRGTHLLTGEVQKRVAASGISEGLCHLFLQHTSAGLMLCENADPDVRADLEDFMVGLVPDGPQYRHSSEGPDDMPSHIRSLLTGFDLTLPVGGGRCLLGTWQGIYLWEHRDYPHRRTVILTVTGE